MCQQWTGREVTMPKLLLGIVHHWTGHVSLPRRVIHRMYQKDPWHQSPKYFLILSSSPDKVPLVFFLVWLKIITSSNALTALPDDNFLKYLTASFFYFSKQFPGLFLYFCWNIQSANYLLRWLLITVLSCW